MTSGPVATDICNLLDATINAVFTGTGTYKVTTADMVNYPPGAYNFEITGHVGSNNAKETFIATFVDPCTTTPLSIITPEPFVDTTYRLRTPAMNLPWDIDNLITQESLVDCGPLTVGFINEDLSAFDPDIFNDDRTAGDFKFEILYSEDITKKGLYPLLYLAYFANYGLSNVLYKDAPFTVRIIDPCDEPISVVAATLTNQEYTITDDDAVPYTVPVYTADPAWCEIRYTYTITGVPGDAVLDPLTR